MVIIMALPPKTQIYLIKKRLKGKTGKTKIKEIEKILTELPGFNTGDYGEIKKWLRSLISQTKTRSKVQSQEYFSVKKEGDKQFVLVGLPNIGKSSLLKNLCGLQTDVGNYEFTTLKPIPGIVNVNGAKFQIVDLPGLVEGASEDKGMGKRFLGVVKSADGIIFMVDLSKPDFVILKELEGINKPMLVVGSKKDLASGKYDVDVAISNQTKEGYPELLNKLWNISGLIKVHSQDDVILKKGSTVKDFILKIHRDLIEKFKYARVTGSTKFPKQQVGLSYELQDEDEIELVLKR